MSNSEISFYVDTLLVETVLGQPKLHKTAGFVSDLLSKVKEYFDSKINKEHPAASVINILAPGTLWAVFKAMGLGTWGMLIGLLMNVFHVDAYGILVSLYNKVRGMISGDKKISSAEIDEAANSAAQEHLTEVTPEQAEQGFDTLQKMQPVQQADDHRVYSSLELLDDAKMIRLAMIQYEYETLRLTKTAVSRGSFLSGFSNTRAKGTSLLSKIFGWAFKIALGSAGLLVAGDVVRKFVGMDDHPSGSGAVPTEPAPTTTQKKYPFKGDAPMPRSMPITNNPANIDNMIIQFAKDVYSGLDGKENLIRNTPGFQVIKEKIAWYNSDHPESSQTFIPPAFTSKKQLVDYFIDDVARANQA